VAAGPGRQSRLRRLPAPDPARDPADHLRAPLNGIRLGEEAARRLAEAGEYDIGPGLTGAELARIERDCEFEFADDHRAFLAAGLPLNARPEEGRAGRPPWPDWRDGGPCDLRQRLRWPIDGVLFDVENNAVWHPAWGQRPADISEALNTARRHLARAPKMIPVYEHRYLPAGRGTSGHPVLSMYQTDIIIYGTDLENYITNEFTGSGALIREDWSPPPMVRFWSDFL
jgi:hypothetical protein